MRDFPEDRVFFRVFYSSLALLNLCVLLLLPFIVLSRNKHCTCWKWWEFNLHPAPIKRLHSTVQKIKKPPRAVNRIYTVRRHFWISGKKRSYKHVYHTMCVLHHNVNFLLVLLNVSYTDKKSTFCKDRAFYRGANPVKPRVLSGWPTQNKL